MSRDATLARSVRLLAVVSTAALLVVLASVGAVATVSELQGTWVWYLKMEKFITASTPLALGLTGVAVLASFGLAVTAER